MEATLSEWKEFIDSAVYRDIMNEINERRSLIIPRLVQGNDSQWSDDSMRGRLDELEFVASIPTDMISAMELEKGIKPKEESFMDKLFNSLKTINKGED